MAFNFRCPARRFPRGQALPVGQHCLSFNKRVLLVGKMIFIGVTNYESIFFYSSKSTEFVIMPICNAIAIGCHTRRGRFRLRVSVSQEIFLGSLIRLFLNWGSNTERWKSMIKTRLSSSFHRKLSSRRSWCDTPNERSLFIDFEIELEMWELLTSVSLIGLPAHAMSSICRISPAPCKK